MLRKILICLMFVSKVIVNNTFGEDTLSIHLSFSKNDYFYIEKQIINIPNFDLKKTDSFSCDRSFISYIDFDKIISFKNIWQKNEMINKKNIKYLNEHSKEFVMESTKFKPKKLFEKTKVTYTRFGLTRFGNYGYSSFSMNYHPKVSKGFFSNNDYIVFFQIYDFIKRNPDDFVFEINGTFRFWCVRNNKLYILDTANKEIVLHDYHKYLSQNILGKIIFKNNIFNYLFRGDVFPADCPEFQNKSSEILKLNFK
ncbi:MAG TPA: hypothetical protein PKX92_14295 [Edaphocola sp.]|nr:hypothetical protein [Edaphocola sp.]